MQTDKIKISSNGTGMAQALEECDRFAAYTGLDKRSALHVRLLAEEALGMVRGIVGQFQADFWLETAKKKGKSLCRICVKADAEVDYERRKELLQVSTSGRNSAAVGVMGKIRELIELGLQGYDEASRYQAQQGFGMADYASMGMMEQGVMTDAFYWSLDLYKVQVAEMDKDSAEAEEAWDELEKSVVAKLADEVRVGIRDGQVELNIEKFI
jgi:hypothetical protein